VKGKHKGTAGNKVLRRGEIELLEVNKCPHLFTERGTAKGKNVNMAEK
jgi:hypothetical protein